MLDDFLLLPTFLLSMWLFVPLLLTQSYLVGFSVDYNRFLYFLILPLIIFIAVVIEHGSGFFAHIIVTYRSLTSQTKKTLKKTTNKKLARLSAALTHRISMQALSYFSYCSRSLHFQSLWVQFTMLVKQFRVSIKLWIIRAGKRYNGQKLTPLKIRYLFLTRYMVGGLAGLPSDATYSAVDPQYLTINEEYNKTLFARNLLDTDYLIDNGYFQVREDGGYLARHNPEFLAHIRNDYFPYPFFNFDSDANSSFAT